MTLVFLAHLFATVSMVGLIWFVQVVHYPLFDRVGAEGFIRYAADHQNLTGFVVIPFMLVELAGAALLVVARPESVPGWSTWLGLGLVVLIWGSTFLLQVPQHATLSAGFDEAAYRFLVWSNWVRTFAWTARGLLVVWMTSRLIGGSS